MWSMWIPVGKQEEKQVADLLCAGDRGAERIQELTAWCSHTLDHPASKSVAESCNKNTKDTGLTTARCGDRREKRTK